jgi:hypothetical protein
MVIEQGIWRLGDQPKKLKPAALADEALLEDSKDLKHQYAMIMQAPEFTERDVYRCSRQNLVFLN